MKRSIQMLTIAAAALIGSLAIAAPASANTVQYQKFCYYTTYGVRCAYRPVTTTATQTAPVRQTAASTATNSVVASGLTTQEQQMLNLVNQERARRGIPALKADLQLTRAARIKSQDMISKRYFSHNSPTYGSPFQMLQRFGISYRTAGENIAGNSTVSGGHTALMNSTGHRANILSRSFTHVGIGIVDGGQYGKMFTQLFVGR